MMRADYRAQPAAQTLHRGLDILDVVARGCATGPEIAQQLGLSRSTTYRLIAGLAERGYLHVNGAQLRLGSKIAELSHRAADRIDLPRRAQPVLDALSKATSDAANLGVRTESDVVYIAQSPGARRLTVRHRVGDRNRLHATALGQALLLDFDAAEAQRLAGHDAPAQWINDFIAAKNRGQGYHSGEADGEIVCIASPIRNAAGAIVAALSLSTLRSYLYGAKVGELEASVQHAALLLSGELGYRLPP